MNRSSLLNLPLARVLTADKHIDSPLLNLLGIQVLRQVAARGWLALRQAMRLRSGKIAGVKALREEGLWVVPDFLPPAEFQRLREECVAALDDPSLPKSDLRHGPTIVRRIHLGSNLARLPRAAAASADPGLLALLGAVEGKDLRPEQLHRVVERVFHGPLDQHDPENDLHVDTFHSTHKVWLYLDDVGPEQGPLAVVPRSHRLDACLLRNTYRYFRDLGRKPGSPSRRVGGAEVSERGLAETALVVRANTLVVANTGGYHRRLRGVDGGVRTALHVSVRSQPFLYWVHAASRQDY